jgi:hypothetical protein
MATRARIALELKDGSFISSYQHWDGYPGGLGYNLIENWDNYDKVKEAIELGDASKWGAIVGEKIDFDDRENPMQDVQNVYYGRDRGEKDVGYHKHLNGVCLLDEAFDCSEEFLYIFKETKDGVWEWFYVDEYKDKNTPIPLYEDAIKDKISILKRILDMKKENQSI